jgi:indolepyruvate ferredoxin oxidoreductase
MSNLDAVREPSLDERYELEHGRVFLTGTQALARLLIDQQRRDASAGLRTQSFITGYPGSPLSGLDIVLHSANAFLQKHGVRHAPAQNEESAAGMLMGTQMLDQHPHPDVDGVNGYWYGKGPGLDRAGDAIKHGNFAGTSKLGAVVILSGEDHEAKSSTVPYQQEFSFEHAGIPVLYPASVAEFLEYGLHAVAMSRHSGCWVSLKLAGSLCDGGETVKVDRNAPAIVVPERTVAKPLGTAPKYLYFPGFNLNTEQNLYYERHDAVRAYARANKLDRIVVQTARDQIGIVAAGKTFNDVVRALRELGYDDRALNAAGIRLLKIALLCPIEAEIVREFARGLKHIVVVEEKRDFLERQIGRIACDLATPVRLVGKFDEDGKPLFPIHGAMDFDFVAGALGRVLARHVTLPQAAQRRAGELDAIARRAPVTGGMRRSLNFCSGCPHNVGVRLAHGQTAWGSPGCHIFAALSPEPARRIDAVTQFGGEGLPWLGLAPFTSRKHIVQNVGDGGLYHSAYLNIRAAVSAKVSMTFKVLHNGAIANTGGQDAVSARTIPELARLLATDRVARIAVITKDRRSYRRARLPSNTIVREPGDMEAVLEEFEAVDGVTVVIYDGQCANERRRKQKRGKLPPPTEFTIVHEDVCENCGACGEVANCMSLQKVATEFGPKTVIHQSSCNQDQTCVSADCPSFVTVKTARGGGLRKPKLPAIAADLPEPARPHLDRPYHIYSPGVGGTGVITANAILGQAATIDGNRALSFDQTGAAQKWGAVLSSLIVAPPSDEAMVNAVGRGQADLYLALDLLAATEANNLARCAPERTAAVINSAVLPNSEMIRNVRAIVPEKEMIAAITAVTDRQRSCAFDARAIAEALFGDYMMTNMVMIGAAYQRGLLPISAGSIETAIRLNGVAVEANIQAFRAGRLSVQHPARLNAVTTAPPATFADRIAELARRPKPGRRAAVDRLMAGIPALDAETKELLRRRIDDVIAYQDAAYGARYADKVRMAINAERAATGGLDIARAVVRNLHKLMTYKDEYEVARLLIQETFQERAAAAFDSGAKLYYNLQPPLLRSFGLAGKIALGMWFTPALRALAAARFLRGTAFDPFGHAAVRRLERELVVWYEKLLDDILPLLTAANAAAISEIVNVPDDIRGYEDLKLHSAAKARQRAQDLLAQLQWPPAARIAAE